MRRETAELVAGTKNELTDSFFAVDATDQPIGKFALAQLPERFFRKVIEQHNAQVTRIRESVPERRHQLRQVIGELLIPTFEEFQARLADRDQKLRISAEHRKIRDFAVYRSWVLDEAPIRTIFRETFFRPQFSAYAPERHRRGHSFVVGRSGSGKSEVLKLLALATKLGASGLRKDASLVLIDPHGDLAEQLAQQRCFAQDFRDRPDDPDLLYLDPFLGMGTGDFPTLNPLDVDGRRYNDLQREKIAQQLSRVFESLVIRADHGLTLNMETILVPCLNVLLRRPGSTFYDLLRFMDDEVNSDLIALGQQSPNPGHRFFFETSFLARRFDPTKGALSTKIQALLNNRAFATFLAQPRSTVDLEGALEQGKTVILNCAIGKSGAQTAEALGRFFVGMLLGIAFNRAESGQQQRKPIWLCIDEVQNFVSDELKTILSQARKYGLHLTLATQVVGQGMNPELTRVVLGNTAVQMIGGAGADSQAQMAKEMGVRAADLTDMAVGEFAVRCGSVPPIRVHMSAEYVGNRNQMGHKEWQQLRALQLERYYQPLQEVLKSDTSGGQRDSEEEENRALSEDILAAESISEELQLEDADPSLVQADNPFADLEE